MTENPWIQVEASEINPEVPANINGVNVRVSFSPYDVPRMYRGRREKESEYFIIEFRYLLEDEPTKRIKTSTNLPIELEVGKISSRIYKIFINVVNPKRDMVRLEIAKVVVQAIENFKSSVPERQRARYKMPEKLVIDERDRILADISSSPV